MLEKMRPKRNPIINNGMPQWRASLRALVLVVLFFNRICLADSSQNTPPKERPRNPHVGSSTNYTAEQARKKAEFHVDKVVNGPRKNGTNQKAINACSHAVGFAAGLGCGIGVETVGGGSGAGYYTGLGAYAVTYTGVKNTANRVHKKVHLEKAKMWLKRAEAKDLEVHPETAGAAQKSKHQ